MVASRWRGGTARARRAPRGERSALAELRRPARLVAAVLLALDLARVAGQQAVVAQQLVEVLVLRAQRARDAEAHRAGLAGRAAAGDVRPDVVVVARLGDDQRLLRGAPRVVGDEELVELATVDHELAGARLDAHARRRRLAATGAPDVRVVHCHDSRSSRAFGGSAGSGAAF